jgi:hypothetical protein
MYTYCSLRCALHGEDEYDDDGSLGVDDPPERSGPRFPPEFKLESITSNNNPDAVQVRYAGGVIDNVSRVQALDRVKTDAGNNIQKISWTELYTDIRRIGYKYTGQELKEHYPGLVEHFNYNVGNDEDFILLQYWIPYGGAPTPGRFQLNDMAEAVEIYRIRLTVFIEDKTKQKGIAFAIRNILGSKLTGSLVAGPIGTIQEYIGVILPRKLEFEGGSYYNKLQKYKRKLNI